MIWVTFCLLAFAMLFPYKKWQFIYIFDVVMLYSCICNIKIGSLDALFNCTEIWQQSAGKIELVEYDGFAFFSIFLRFCFYIFSHIFNIKFYWVVAVNWCWSLNVRKRAEWNVSLLQNYEIFLILLFFFFFKIFWYIWKQNIIICLVISSYL